MQRQCASASGKCRFVSLWRIKNFTLLPRAADPTPFRQMFCLIAESRFFLLTLLHKTNPF